MALKWTCLTPRACEVMTARVNNRVTGFGEIPLNHIRNVLEFRKVALLESHGIATMLIWVCFLQCSHSTLFIPRL